MNFVRNCEEEKGISFIMASVSHRGIEETVSSSTSSSTTLPTVTGKLAQAFSTFDSQKGDKSGVDVDESNDSFNVVVTSNEAIDNSKPFENKSAAESSSAAAAEPMPNQDSVVTGIPQHTGTIDTTARHGSAERGFDPRKPGPRSASPGMKRRTLSLSPAPQSAMRLPNLGTRRVSIEPSISELVTKIEKMQESVDNIHDRQTELAARFQIAEENYNKNNGDLTKQIEAMNDISEAVKVELIGRIDNQQDRLHQLSELSTDLRLAIKSLEITNRQALENLESRTENFEIHSPPGISPSPTKPLQAFPGCGPATPPLATAASASVFVQGREEYPRNLPKVNAQATRSTVEEEEEIECTMPGLAPIVEGRSMFGRGKAMHKEISYKISYKGTEHLSRCSGSIVEFKNWSETMISHLCGATRRYANIMEVVMKGTEAFNKLDLMDTLIDGFNAWEISLELGGFTLKYLTKAITDDKHELCGSKEDNGFELWRNLQIRYGGQGTVVEVGGFTTFTEFPRCMDEKNLLRHVSKWEELLGEYASELKRSPESLRTMLIRTLPIEYEHKLLHKRDKYPTYQSILKHVREKLEGRRQITISEALHGKGNRKSYLHAFTGDTEKTSPTVPVANTAPVAPVAPSMTDLADMIAASTIAALNGQGRPAKKTGQGDKSSAKKRKTKFFFRGCWECADLKHSRHECPKWKALLDRDGRPPAGHKGAKDKAYAEWKKARDAARKKKTGKINALGDDDTEDEDDTESESDDDIAPHRIFALNNSSRTLSPTISPPPRRRITEKEEHLALFNGLPAPAKSAAFVCKQWDNKAKKFNLSIEEARDDCSKLPTVMVLDRRRIEQDGDGECGQLTYAHVNWIMTQHGLDNGRRGSNGKLTDQKSMWGKYRTGVEIRNGFEALDEAAEKEEEDDASSNSSSEIMNAVTRFAHKALVGKKVSQKVRRKQDREDERAMAEAILVNEKRRRTQASESSASSTKETQSPKEIVIRNVDELDSEEVKNIIHALPSDRKALAKLAKKCPTDVALEQGEIWVLADTGSTKNALKISRDCPEYARLLRPNAASRRGGGAESACGGFIQERGEVTLVGRIDDEDHEITFSDMDVTMPIASMRKAVKKGSDLIITSDGGRITNKQTGTSIRLYERQGAWFFKMKLYSPEETERRLGKDFQRRG